jgi:Tfp pilus assembly protein PilW
MYGQSEFEAQLRGRFSISYQKSYSVISKFPPMEREGDVSGVWKKDRKFNRLTTLQHSNTHISSSNITLNALTYSLFTVVRDHQLERRTNHNLQRNSLIRVRFVANQSTFQVSAHGKGGCSVVWKKDRKIEVNKRT